ncbi:MAG: hypothetical protein IPK04_15580 [Bdellovibrionales bacterium]|nr:hypothetical protein [Bdellovibrionales bacterium]
MQFTEMKDVERATIQVALLKYCELDTLDGVVAGVLEKFTRLTVYSGEHLGGFGYKKLQSKILLFAGWL